jgi:hypothetical protein
MQRARIFALGATLLFAALAAAQEGASETKPAEGADVASEKEVDAAAAPPEAEEACFFVRDIDDFDALSDEFIFVEGRGDENYLLTMWSGCFALDGAVGIAVSSPMSRVCSTSGAEIRYRGLGRLESCRIRAVEAVESKEIAEALVEQRSAQ